MFCIAIQASNSLSKACVPAKMAYKLSQSGFLRHACSRLLACLHACIFQSCSPPATTPCMYCICSYVTFPESSVMADTRCFLVECPPLSVLTFPCHESCCISQCMCQKGPCPVSLCLCLYVLVCACMSGARCEDAQAWRLPQMPLLQHILCQQAVQVGASEPLLHGCLYLRLTVAPQCESYCISGVIDQLVWQTTLSQLSSLTVHVYHVSCPSCIDSMKNCLQLHRRKDH